MIKQTSSVVKGAPPTYVLFSCWRFISIHFPSLSMTSHYVMMKCPWNARESESIVVALLGLFGSFHQNWCIDERLADGSCRAPVRNLISVILLLSCQRIMNKKVFFFLFVCCLLFCHLSCVALIDVKIRCTPVWLQVPAGTRMTHETNLGCDADVLVCFLQMVKTWRLCTLWKARMWRCRVPAWTLMELWWCWSGTRATIGSSNWSTTRRLSWRWAVIWHCRLVPMLCCSSTSSTTTAETIRVLSTATGTVMTLCNFSSKVSL